MARICQVSGKKANNAKHIRNTHSQGWKYKAPKKNRWQLPNLHTVKLNTPTGSHRITVSTSVMKSEIYNMVACGLKPVPKAWLKKAAY
jgi:large subunit ribosomal protein L28